MSKYVAEYLSHIDAIPGYYKWLKTTYPEIFNEMGKVQKTSRKRKK